MSKTFTLRAGRLPDPAYVDDPAGGQALRFVRGTGPLLQAPHADFGNATMWPGGAAGNCEITLTFRAAIDVYNNANTNNREIFDWRPARWDGASWVLAHADDFRIRLYMSGHHPGRLTLDITNNKGGQSFGTRRFEFSPADTIQYCDGKFRDYRWRLVMRPGNNPMAGWVDGVSINNNHSATWLNAAPNFDYGADTYIGNVMIGHATGGMTCNVSALRLEIKKIG